MDEYKEKREKLTFWFFSYFDFYLFSPSLTRHRTYLFLLMDACIKHGAYLSIDIEIDISDNFDSPVHFYRVWLVPMIKWPRYKYTYRIARKSGWKNKSKSKQWRHNSIAIDEHFMLMDRMTRVTSCAEHLRKVRHVNNLHLHRTQSIFVHLQVMIFQCCFEISIQLNDTKFILKNTFLLIILSFATIKI